MANQGSLGADETARLLSEESRRIVLRYLFREDGSTTMEELSRAVADRREADDVLERTNIRLHHIDLPMLADYGVIRWDVATGVVEKRSRADALKPALQAGEPLAPKKPKQV